MGKSNKVKLKSKYSAFRATFWAISFAAIGIIGLLAVRAAPGGCSTTGVVGSSSYNISVPETAQYRIWVRMQTTNTTNTNNTNGVRLEIDGASDQCFQITSTNTNNVNQWQWINSDATASSVGHVTSQLTAGNYTVKILGLKEGIKVDKVLLLKSDNTCIPDNFNRNSVGANGREPGDNCTTPPPTVNLTANPTSIVAGNASTLTWSSTNATSCTSTGGWTGSRALSGSFTTSSLTTNTTFGLTCSGIGGSGSATTSVNVTPSPDTTAPSVSLTAPSANQTVSGTITITATATDSQSAIASVSYYLDGSSTPFSTDVSAPFNSSWNSATVTNGSHSIIARATDAAGNVGTSSSVTFTVSNIVPDTTAPTTNITDPANNTTIKGAKVVQATASDNVGIARVELLIDGVVKGIDTSSPYSFSWDTATYADGAHTIQTRAFDAANNQNTSSVINVTVDNITDPTPPAKEGDTNGDNVVNRTDLRVLLINYTKFVTPFTNGDFNGDGKVDRTDLRVLLINYGK